MRKVLGVFAAITLVFSFAAVAGAQTNLQEVTCTTCNKCTLQNVPCPQTVVGVQGSVTVTEACPFDYDDAYGYCSNSEGNTEFDALGEGIAARKCRVIFNICDCPDACNLYAGTEIGIQMTIMTTGVYWAEDAKAYDANGNRTIWFGAYGSETAACIPGRDDMPMDRNFGVVTYYAGISESFDEAKNMLRRSPTGAGVPADGCLTGNIPVANRMTVLESSMDTDYVITATDVRNKYCRWWIDIPALRLDGTATQGSQIKIRVTLLSQRTSEVLCPECNPPVMCECFVTVGVVCCEAKDANSGCIFFPYVLQGLEDSSGWVSGIAVSATGTALPDDAYCKLTLKDTLGNTATWTNSNLGDSLVWAFVLDRVMSNFNKVLEPGACSLKIESNYRMDGYTFMNANMEFGTGTLPRACDGVCTP